MEETRAVEDRREERGLIKANGCLPTLTFILC